LRKIDGNGRNAVLSRSLWTSVLEKMSCNKENI
jgi:hypothetical protein